MMAATMRSRRRTLLTAVAVVSLGGATPAHAAPGDLDPSFGQGGAVDTGRGALDVAVRKDGRIVLFGFQAGCGADRRAPLAARLLPDGRGDPRFRHAGYRCLGLPDSELGLFAGALRDDDHLVLAGGEQLEFESDRRTRPLQTALFGFRASGRIDSGFGRDGRQVRNLGNRGWDFARAVAVGRRGEIAAAGFVHHGGSTRGFVARYTRDGDLNRRFGRRGRVIPSQRRFGDEFEAVEVQPDGRILAAGGRSEDDRIVLMRFRRDGRIDSSFGGGDGIATVAAGGSDVDVPDIALEPDGDILVVGGGGRRNDDVFVTARWTARGRLDRSFADDGVAKATLGGPDTEPQAEAHAVLVQPDGRIVVAGGADFVEVHEDGGRGERDRVSLVRYLPDGGPDPSFGRGGVAYHGFGTATGLARSASGAILASVSGGRASVLQIQP